MIAGIHSSCEAALGQPFGGSSRQMGRHFKTSPVRLLKQYETGLEVPFLGVPILISHSRRCESNGHGFLQKTIQNARAAKSNRDDCGTGCKECAHNRFLPTLLAKSCKEPKSGS